MTRTLRESSVAHRVWLPGHGPRALATFRLDTGEDRRRRLVGLGGLTDLALLDSLLSLPIGLPVPVGRLGAGALGDLRRAPDGVVRQTSEGVVRLARPPLALERIIVRAGRDWRRALRRACEFGRRVERVIDVLEPPRDLDELRLHASYYGVGVLSDGERLVDPEPVPRRHTAVRWRFAERVYERLLAGLDHVGSHGGVSA